MQPARLPPQCQLIIRHSFELGDFCNARLVFTFFANASLVSAQERVAVASLNCSGRRAACITTTSQATRLPLQLARGQRPRPTTIHFSPLTNHWETQGHGRGCGVGRGLGVALGGGVGDWGGELGVAVGVAVSGGGVSVAVAVGVGVTGGTVAVAVAVGVGVMPGVGLGVDGPHGVALDTGVGETVGVGAGVPTAVAILTRPQP